MSRTSKIVFASSIIGTTLTIAGVFYLKDQDFKTRRQGIERDDRKRSTQRLENEAEARIQEELRQELLKTQKIVSQTSAASPPPSAVSPSTNRGGLPASSKSINDDPSRMYYSYWFPSSSSATSASSSSSKNK